jgi:hypothetical protein
VQLAKTTTNAYNKKRVDKWKATMLTVGKKKNPPKKPTSSTDFFDHVKGHADNAILAIVIQERPDVFLRPLKRAPGTLAAREQTTAFPGNKLENVAGKLVHVLQRYLDNL